MCASSSGSKQLLGDGGGGVDADTELSVVVYVKLCTGCTLSKEENGMIIAVLYYCLLRVYVTC